jgi:alanine-glyoxylate transaminase/serine-glyoxylate transaminase/serine-pyruvate transaminase
MSLGHGRHYLAIPGPSVLPDRVLRAMQRPSPNIYTGELVEMVPGLVADLKRVARTEGDVAIYVANGHGAWEASLANVLAPGDRALSLVTGRFGSGWADCAERLGARVDRLDFGLRAPVDPQRVEEALRADRSREVRAVTMVQADTSTSVLSDVGAVREAIDAAGHPAILMVDAIACLGCDRMEMDDWGADVVVTGSQKGLMSPPGLAFVFLSGLADDLRGRREGVSPYWDWRPRIRPEGFYEYFWGTAPTHHLYALREALDMLHEEGVEAAWARHERLARAVWAALDAWSARGPLVPNVAEVAHRSRAVTTIRLGAPATAGLRAWLEERAGVTLGIGLPMGLPEDERGEGVFRIGHMGHVNAHMVMGALGAIRAGLEAQEVEIGGGGLEAAAAVIAEA